MADVNTSGLEGMALDDQHKHVCNHSHDMDEAETEVSEEAVISLTVNFRGIAYPLSTPEDWTLSDLASFVSETYGIPNEKQKYMITPRGGTYKYPFPAMQVTEIKDKKIVLLGTPTTEVDDLQRAITLGHYSLERRGRRSGRSSTWHRSRPNAAESSQYTFHSIKPLTYLPNPERSQRFLERLANDAGIKAAMLKHKFAVGLLTEMDPAMHTTHESRTLGLNRNAGEVIELRLRTDAYDGYRDYKTIRKTLCHELSHNVWGPHDKNFWALTRQIEDDVEKGDWTRGGRSVGQEEFYNPNDEGVTDEDLMDHDWVGGTNVLGNGVAASREDEAGLSLRERAARAATRRADEIRELSRQGRIAMEKQAEEDRLKNLARESEEGREGEPS